MMKRILYILIFLSALQINAQNEATAASEELTQKMLDKYSYVSETDAQNGGYKIDISKINFYSVDKKLLARKDAMGMLTNGKYGADLYADKSKKITVAVLRPSTEEEKAAFKKRQEEFKIVQPDEYVGQKAKPFELEGMDGTVYNMEDLKGKVVVINFWFIGCAPCVKEMPELNELVMRNTDNDVVFLGVANDRKDKLESFLTKTDFNYNIIPSGQGLAMSYNIMGFPSHLVIDRDGVITYGASGFGQGSVDRLSAAVSDAVAKK